MLRVTLSETELQTLRPGEYYDVPPAVGRVLVSEGWAVEPDVEVQDTANDRGGAAPNDRGRRSTS
jgi:hypothetical protein